MVDHDHISLVPREIRRVARSVKPTQNKIKEQQNIKNYKKRTPYFTISPILPPIFTSRL